MLLDTSAAIALRDSAPELLSRFETIGPLPYLSILSVVELEGGVAGSTIGFQQRRQSLDRLIAMLEILPFGRGEAAQYRAIVESWGFARSKIIDRMIAATALAHNLSLATLNARDFRDIPGLRLEDWSA